MHDGGDGYAELLEAGQEAKRGIRPQILVRTCDNPAVLAKGRESRGVIFKEERMKRARITLARLMIVVAVVAVELAAFIVACRRVGGDWVLGLPPMGVACQIGLLCAVLSRGLSRAFWTGFVVFGCAMMAHFAWGLYFWESAVNEPWASYGDFAVGVIETSPWAPQLLSDGGDVAMAVTWLLPQLAAACAGGVFVLLATLVMRPFFRVRALDNGQEKGRASLPPSSEPLGSAEATH
jgi:hypothetical protein